jgi:hypothetical protein
MSLILLLNTLIYSALWTFLFYQSSQISLCLVSLQVRSETWDHMGVFHQCDGSGEDPSCSDSVLGISIPDHLHYMGEHCCSG